MKKILVTGANGFVGKALCSALQKDYSVMGIGRSASECDNYSKLDLGDKDKVFNFFKVNKFDVIIHLATILANAENKEDNQVFFKNIEMQTNLIKALAHYQDCQLINFSSSAVYPNISGLFSENDIIDPSVNNDGLYGLAKFNSEMLFKMLLPKEMVQLHLRLGYIYGKGLNPVRIHSMFKKELLENNTITVFGNGIRTIPQISLDSLSGKIKYFIKNSISGTINIADENISLEGIAKNLVEKYGNLQSEIKYVERGNKNTFAIKLDKLNKILKC